MMRNTPRQAARPVLPLTAQGARTAALRRAHRALWLAAGTLLIATLPALAQDELDALFSDAPASQQDEDSTEQNSPAGPERRQAPDEQEQPDSTANTVVLEPEAVEAPAARDKPAAIEEIIVTATKREASNRELTQTVDVMTGQKIEEAGILDITQLIESIPGVNIMDDDSCLGCPPAITIRGVSSSLTTNGTAGLYFDEVPLSDVGYAVATPDVSPFDLSTVEILKGPVGTLFGGSSLNGAVRYIPNRPVLGEWGARAYTELRSTDQSESLSRTGGLVVNAPWGDSWAARLMLERQDLAGLVDNLNPAVDRRDTDTKDQQTLRLGLSAAPLDRLKLDLTYLDQNTRNGDFGLVQLDDNPEQDFQKYAGAIPSTSDIDVRILELKGAWAFDRAELSLTLGWADKAIYSEVDFGAYLTGNPPETAPTTPVVFAVLDGWAKPRSQELRLVSTAPGNWDWTVGLYNYDNTFLVDAESSSGGNPATAAFTALANQLGYHQNLFAQNGGIESISARPAGTAGERAVFADVSWRFHPKFEANAGLRLFEFFYDVDSRYRGAYCLLAGTGCNPTTLDGQILLDAKERGLGPKLSLRWQALDNLMSYATLSRGFRFGGLNASVPHPDTPATYDSDTLWNFEIGVRTDWLERSLIADATVFLLKWSDAQYLTSTSDGLSTYTDNAGELRGKGIEGNIMWNTPLKGVRMNASATLMELKTADSFPTSSSSSVGPGEDWPRAPKLQYSLNLSWTGNLRDRILSLGTSFNHQGEAPQGFLITEDGVKVFGYSTLNAFASLAGSRRSWLPDLQLNFNNITNERGPQFRIPPGTPTGSNMVRFSAPRSVALRLGWEW